MQKEDISRFLENEFKKPIKLRLNTNRSTFLSARVDKDGSISISLHECFKNADSETLQTLVRFVQKGKASDRNLLRSFVHNFKVESPRKVVSRKINSVGGTYDLKPMSDDLNSRYFQSDLQFQITWNNRALTRKKRVKQMTLGKCYYADKLIVMHPILDQAKIPRTFIEYVVYHEMCHIAIKPRKTSGGRMLAHSPEFKALEQKYANFQIAKTFENKQLPRLINAWHKTDGKNSKEKMPLDKSNRLTQAIKTIVDDIQLMLF